MQLASYMSDFPSSDYQNFVKKCMKQLQSDKFMLLRRIDVELTPLDSTQEQLIPGKSLSIYIKLLTNHPLLSAG